MNKIKILIVLSFLPLYMMGQDIGRVDEGNNFLDEEEFDLFIQRHESFDEQRQIQAYKKNQNYLEYENGVNVQGGYQIGSQDETMGIQKALSRKATNKKYNQSDRGILAYKKFLQSDKHKKLAEKSKLQKREDRKALSAAGGTLSIIKQSQQGYGLVKPKILAEKPKKQVDDTAACDVMDFNVNVFLNDQYGHQESDDSQILENFQFAPDINVCQTPKELGRQAYDYEYLRLCNLAEADDSDTNKMAKIQALKAYQKAYQRAYYYVAKK